MKSILLLFALILFAGVLAAQRVTNTDILQVKTTMALKNVVIDSISKDGTISAPSDGKLMTSDAIKEYVDAATGGGSTLAGVSVLSTDATESLYTMTATIPVEFESSDFNPILYLNETSERVGIGTISPGHKLDVSGSVNISETNQYKQDGDNVIHLEKGTDIFYANTIAGASAGSTIPVSRQSAFGGSAGYLNTGANQTAVGYQAGRQNTGANQVAFGYLSGYLNTGANQTAFGIEAGRSNTGANQVTLGSYAGYFNTGTNQSAVGYYAGYQNTGTNQTAAGNFAGLDNTGTNQTAVGYDAGRGNTGANNTNVGYQAGRQNTGTFQSAFGYQAGYLNIGAGQSALGYQAGYENTEANQNAFGYQAGYENTANDQSAFGSEAGYQNTGTFQSAFGSLAGYLNTGTDQSALGYQAGRQNSGINQTAVGSLAGYQNTGANNTNVGYQAGRYTTVTTPNTASSTSVFLGADTKAGGATRSNQIVIGYNAEGLGSNTVTLGNNSIVSTYLKGNVAIGMTTTPVSKAHIYEDNANTDATVGLTIEQDGAGDAAQHLLLTGGQRYTTYIDNSDGDKYKLSTPTNDFISIDDVNNIALVKVLDTGIDRSLSVRSNGIQLIHDDGANDSALGFGPSGSFVLSTDDGTESSVQSQSATGGWGVVVDDAVDFNNVSITADRTQLVGQVAFNSKISPVISADQDNWSPTGLGNCNWIAIDNGANNVAIGGIVSAKFTNGSRLIIQRLGSGTVTLEHEEGTSTAANRFDCAADSDVSISLWLEIIYDGDLDRWLVNN